MGTVNDWWSVYAIKNHKMIDIYEHISTELMQNAVKFHTETVPGFRLEVLYQDYYMNHRDGQWAKAFTV